MTKTMKQLFLRNSAMTEKSKKIMFSFEDNADRVFFSKR